MVFRPLTRYCTGKLFVSRVSRVCPGSPRCLFTGKLGRMFDLMCCSSEREHGEHHATDVGTDQADDARQMPLGRKKAKNQGIDSLLSNQRSPRSHMHACQRRDRKG